MIRPKNFGYNPLTAESNAFQQTLSELTPEEVQQQAVKEFDTFVEILREAGIAVIVIEDRISPVTPDAIFPNNWISFHRQGKIILYPMMAPNRRNEVRKDIPAFFQKENENIRVVDFSPLATEGKFLEGTGSMIMDRAHNLVYACMSDRTHEHVFDLFCQQIGCDGIFFHSVDRGGHPIYHTNVMMALGTHFVIICEESIHDIEEREALHISFTRTGHEVIPISHDQVAQFAGNMLEVMNEKGEHYIVMSKRAHDSLSEEQIRTLEKYGRLLVIPIDIIEVYGGGSVRCMMAEVFLPS
ncbi:MAG: arginine deiminase-related protein [Bacteroidota bacterium]